MRGARAAALALGVGVVAFAAPALVLSACGGAPAHGPFFGDDRLIVLGVDPDTEADALSHQLAERGLTEVRRIRGKTFTALGYAPAAEPTRQRDVRVITGRGIALALEARANTALDPGVRYALLPAPYRDTLDADGDGFDELFVSRTPLPAGEPCTLLYRVRDSGFVDAIPTDNYALARAPDVADPGWQQTFCSDPAKESTADKQPSEKPPALKPPAPKQHAEKPPAEKPPARSPAP
jgi:hypothetical protein